MANLRSKLLEFPRKFNKQRGSISLSMIVNALSEYILPLRLYNVKEI